MSTEAGIYVHLPYCRSRCSYCSFVVSTEDSSRSAYVEALDREISLLAPETQWGTFDSVYLGGGTPSLSPAEDLDRLLEALRRRFSVAVSAEVTLEANPEDVTPERARAWIATGVTRVSVGVQSFNDSELSAVGRRHDALCARRTLETLAATGLSVSGDLILGLPGQTAGSFRSSVEGLCGADVEHVSVYLLETEKSKTLEEDRRQNPSRYLSDDAQADLWLEMGEALARRGFFHYEISNWARPGRESRHNLKYWRRTPTLGLGVSAHEFWSGRRRANVAGLSQYIAALEAGRRPVAIDRAVTAEEEAGERIVLGLRLSDGVRREEIEGWVTRSRDAMLRDDYALWRDERLLEEAAGLIHFTERGFLVSNEILCRFV